MINNYESYLIIILILVLTVPAFAILIFIRRGNRKSKRNKAAVVTGGSVSVFFDKPGNATLIPYVKDKYGNGKATKEIHTLEIPYTPQKLGLSVKRSLNGCASSKACSDTELFNVLEVKDWAQFAHDKRNISVYFREEYGIVLNSTTKTEDGAYRFNTRGAEITAPSGISDIELGNSILELLERCR